MIPEISKNDPENLEDEDLVQMLDEGIILLLQFIKSQILAESINNEPITPPQFGLLYCLHQRGQITMSELSREMHLTHGASTGMVDRLVKMKLVERQRSKKDRRIVFVSISSRGKELIERMRIRRHAILKKIIQEMNTEERYLLLKVNRLIKEKIKHVV